MNEQLTEWVLWGQFDEQWKSDPGYVFYNYKEPEKIPVEFHHKFDYVVVDPPFITDEVWSKYADAIKLVLKKDDKGKVSPQALLLQQSI